MTKFKFQMPKVRLTTVLWVILAVAVLLEAGTIYKYVFVSVARPKSAQTADEVPIKINMKLFQQAAAWVRTGAGYGLSAYSLRQGQNGRDNPFAEYK